MGDHRAAAQALSRLAGRRSAAGGDPALEDLVEVERRRRRGDGRRGAGRRSSGGRAVSSVTTRAWAGTAGRTRGGAFGLSVYVGGGTGTGCHPSSGGLGRASSQAGARVSDLVLLRRVRAALAMGRDDLAHHLATRLAPGLRLGPPLEALTAARQLARPSGPLAQLGDDADQRERHQRAHPPRHGLGQRGQQPGQPASAPAGPAGRRRAPRCPAAAPGGARPARGAVAAARAAACGVGGSRSGSGSCGHGGCPLHRHLRRGRASRGDDVRARVRPRQRHRPHGRAPLEHPHGLGEPVDRPHGGDLVAATHPVAEQVGGPDRHDDDEDQAARVHGHRR